MPSLPATADPAVLIVDDDPAIRASLKFALTIEGFHVDTFATGEELLGRGEFPDRACLIVDHILPAMNGIELVAALRSRGVDVPVILITSDPSPYLRRQAAAAGLSLVEKPLLGNGLAEAIRTALSRQ